MSMNRFRARLVADAGFERSYDRTPCSLSHTLSGLELFRMDYLLRLAERYSAKPQDYFVAAGAPEPGARFYSVPHGHHCPYKAIERLEQEHCRVLMKRPENHDPGFRELLDVLYRQVCDLRGVPEGDGILRLESAVFVSSASTITPFHFDPEVAFFFQIEGEKIYHVYSPQTLTEAELERFYVSGIVNIGQVMLSGRDPGHEFLFRLGPGKGLHQPQNSPHWVETGQNRSISYSFVLETRSGRSLGRTRAFNHYMRKLGVSTSQPGRHPALDAAKAATMTLAMPVRDAARRVLAGAR
jgi:hypothetical protein